MKISYKWVFYDDANYYLDTIPGYFYHFCCDQMGLSSDDYTDNLHVITSRYFLFDSLTTEFDLNDETSFKDIVDSFLFMMGINNEDFYGLNIYPSVFTLNECVDVNDYNIKVKDVMNQFECGDRFEVVFFLSILQGEVFNEDGYCYYMHSNERTNHNLPHVHVSKSGDFDVTIDLLTLNLINGKISTRKLRKIQNVIRKKQELLIYHWNNNTNGITINADYTLKYY